MLIARSPIATLTTIPEDIENRPDLLRCFKDEYGHTQVIEFETDDYRFVWESQANFESTMRIWQHGNHISYQLSDYVPYAKKYGDVTNYLLPEEQRRQKIAVDFIKLAIQEAIELARTG
jgi:hypothetical protein